MTTDKKNFKELSEEDLKAVTGGLARDCHGLTGKKLVECMGSVRTVPAVEFYDVPVVFEGPKLEPRKGDVCVLVGSIIENFKQ